MKWHYLRWAMRRKWAVTLAGRLGRSRGRLRPLAGYFPAPPPPVQPDLSHWHELELAALWIGHATVLIRLGGKTILTDPVFAKRVGLGLGFFTGGPKRLQAPAVMPWQLPPVDLILVSHAHFDHLDRPSLYRLPKATPVITSAHNGDLIRDLGFQKVVELKWGEQERLPGLLVTAVQVRHWGARTVSDSHRGFTGFLVENESASEQAPARSQRVLFCGDTAFHRDFRGLGPVDLAIMPIGAYDPWIEAHADPEEAWTMAGDAQAAHLLPVHHSTFRLSNEPAGEPMHRLLQAAGEKAHQVVIRQVGELWSAHHSDAGAATTAAANANSTSPATVATASSTLSPGAAIG